VTKPNDHSLKACVLGVQVLLSKHPNATFFQKWTCAGCGKRITGNTPNKFFKYGHCEECGHTTDINKTGCNYAVHLPIGGLADVEPEGSA